MIHRFLCRNFGPAEFESRPRSPIRRRRQAFTGLWPLRFPRAAAAANGPAPLALGQSEWTTRNAPYVNVVSAPSADSEATIQRSNTEWDRPPCVGQPVHFGCGVGWAGGMTW